MKENEVGYLEKNKNYKLYKKQKLKLKAKYPSTLFVEGYSSRYKVTPTEEERELFKEYIEKLMKIILKPKGHYQKYVWDTLSPSEKLFREAKVNGSSRRK